MLSILVNPLQERNDYFITRWKRPIEENVLARYLKHIKEKEDNPKKYTHVLKALDQRIKNQERETDISHTTKLKKVVKAAKKEESDKIAAIKKVKEENSAFKQSIVDDGKKKPEKKK